MLIILVEMARRTPAIMELIWAHSCYEPENLHRDLIRIWRCQHWRISQLHRKPTGVVQAGTDSLHDYSSTIYSITRTAWRWRFVENAKCLTDWTVAGRGSCVSVPLFLKQSIQGSWPRLEFCSLWLWNAFVRAEKEPVSYENLWTKPDVFKRRVISFVYLCSTKNNSLSLVSRMKSIVM